MCYIRVNFWNPPKRFTFNSGEEKLSTCFAWEGLTLLRMLLLLVGLEFEVGKSLSWCPRQLKWRQLAMLLPRFSSHCLIFSLQHNVFWLKETVYKIIVPCLPTYCSDGSFSIRTERESMLFGGATLLRISTDWDRARGATMRGACLDGSPRWAFESLNDLRTYGLTLGVRGLEIPLTAAFSGVSGTIHVEDLRFTTSFGSTLTLLSTATLVFDEVVEGLAGLTCICRAAAIWDFRDIGAGAGLKTGFAWERAENFGDWGTVSFSFCSRCAGIGFTFFSTTGSFCTSGSFLNDCDLFRWTPIEAMFARFRLVAVCRKERLLLTVTFFSSFFGFTFPTGKASSSCAWLVLFPAVFLLFNVPVSASAEAIKFIGFEWFRPSLMISFSFLASLFSSRTLLD